MMKILAYFSALILSGFTYLLFAAYMTGSSGLNSVWPLVSFYSSLAIFGFLSWFHFFKPIWGAIMLTLITMVMFFSWPVFLLLEHFNGEFRTAIVESALPLVASIVTITLVWMARKRADINKYLKIGLAVPPLILALYVGGYFTFRFFG